MFLLVSGLASHVFSLFRLYSEVMLYFSSIYIGNAKGSHSPVALVYSGAEQKESLSTMTFSSSCKLCKNGEVLIYPACFAEFQMMSELSFRRIT